MNVPHYRQWCSGYVKDRSKTCQSLKSLIEVGSDLVENMDEESDGLRVEDVMEMQMSHTLKTSKDCYGHDASEITGIVFLNGRSMKSFEMVSLEWHNDLEVKPRATF